MTMELPINAQVNFADGPCGRIARVVIDVRSLKVTHLVVSVSDRYPFEHLVPIEWVVGVGLDSIQLCCTGDYLDLLAPFSEFEWQESGLLDEFLIHRLLVRPVFSSVVKRKRISADELALRCGSWVRATDGRAGRLESLMIDAVDGNVTQLILRTGFKWNAKKAFIPVSQIDCIKDGTIFLKLAKRDVVGLPFASVGEIKLRFTT
jgi:sporulation protein YlmC with PRC-barrel domain